MLKEIYKITQGLGLDRPVLFCRHTLRTASNQSDRAASIGKLALYFGGEWTGRFIQRRLALPNAPEPEIE